VLFVVSTLKKLVYFHQSLWFRNKNTSFCDGVSADIASDMTGMGVIGMSVDDNGFGVAGALEGSVAGAKMRAAVSCVESSAHA
jgi:hypothetical protein